MQFSTETTTSDTGNPLVPSLSIQNKDDSYLLHRRTGLYRTG